MRRELGQVRSAGQLGTVRPWKPIGLAFSCAYPTAIAQKCVRTGLTVAPNQIRGLEVKFPQSKMLSYLDASMSRLYTLLPQNTWDWLQEKHPLSHIPLLSCIYTDTQAQVKILKTLMEILRQVRW